MFSDIKTIADEVKSHNDIVDVISEYIALNEKNKALCPFHDDHSPSFSIHKDKQIFKCFSCGESGNVITFVQKIENISYLEALNKLALRAGLKTNIKTSKKVNKENEKYYEINNTINNYFKNNLLSKDGISAINYLNDRKIDKELINDFNIGLSTSLNIESVFKNKYKVEDLIDVDVIKEGKNGNYSTFVNRIIFPILDEDNNVIAFSGRKYLPNDIKNDEVSKYYNTKDTKIFNKSTILYNINNAKEYIRKKKEIIITEGFMDTIRLWSIGYKNVVALMGTAFTNEHLEKIKKLNCKVVLNLDQDNAGKSNTIVAGDILAKEKIDVSVIVFDDYKDSDEFIVKKGKESFDISYNNKISFIDFKLKYLRDKNNLKDSKEKAKYINDAIKAIDEIEDDILREIKIKDLSNEFDIDESIIKNKIKNKNKKVEKQKIVETNKYNKYYKSEIRIIYLMLNYEDVIISFENELMAGLIHEEMSNLAYEIMKFHNDNGYFDYSDFIDYIKDNELLNKTLKEVMKYNNEESYSRKELDDCIKTINEYSIKNKIKRLTKELNETLDVNKQIEISAKIAALNKGVLKW